MKTSAQYRDESPYAAASAALSRGDPLRAEALCRALLAERDADFQAAFLLGEALQNQGREDAAIAAWERAAALNPGYSLPFSRLTCARLRRRLGPPPAPDASVSRAEARVQMTALGAKGRFGNQLLQYAFLRLYAARHGLAAETPDWIGRYLYGCRDPWLSRRMPRMAETEVDLWAAFRGEAAAVPRGCDFDGYFGPHTHAWGAVADDFRALFVPVPPLRGMLEAAVARLESDGRTLVGVHIRRGDFGYGPFWIAPIRWYLDWLRELWPHLRRPILYLASDDAASAAEFAEFSPLLAADLGVDLAEAPFLIDHFVLSRATYLAISNSSFSFTAAMLNARLAGAMRPDPERRALMAFEPWAAPVTLAPRPRDGAVSSGDLVLLKQSLRGGQTVVYYGGHCANWTTLVRREHPALRVHELEPGQSLDAWRKHHGVLDIHHVRLDPAVSLSSFFAAAHATLESGHVWMIHLGQKPADLLALRGELEGRRLRLCAVKPGGALVVVPPAVAPLITDGRMSWLAIPEHVVPFLGQSHDHA